MIDYQELPIFPLPLVLYPAMPLPLHIFEPRYREMVRRCHESNSVFGILLCGQEGEAEDTDLAYGIGTTAKIIHYEELPDGCIDILVTGESRFQVLETQQRHSYLTAQALPYGFPADSSESADSSSTQASELFKRYVKLLFQRTGRTLSTLQLPQDPEHLSFAIAAFLPLALVEKQTLLEAPTARKRLEQEIHLLDRELEKEKVRQADVAGINMSSVVPADSQMLGRLASRN